MFGPAKIEFYSTFGVPRLITKSLHKLRPEDVIEKRITCKSLYFRTFFSRANRLKRYVWSNDMSQKSDHFWKKVLFSDKTIIELFPKRGTLSVYPNSVEVCKIMLVNKLNTVGKMFWGFIKEPGERKLIKVKNRVNSSVYTNILASHLLL